MEHQKSISFLESFTPVIILITLLSINVYVYGDEVLSGPNQFVLIVGAAIATIIGLKNKVSYSAILKKITSNIESTSEAILILLFVGALSGAWLISGIIPSMIYYGIKILNPKVFLLACVVISSITSLATGSSWTTSATIGIALIGIATTLGIDIAMTAGAVISGAYFGDKLSPLSETTNLAPAIAGVGLYDHIRYLTITTIPSYVITLIAFTVIGFFIDVDQQAGADQIIALIDNSFNVTPWLFIVPLVVFFLIIKKVEPLIALFIATVLGSVFALIFQPHIVVSIVNADTLNFYNAYRAITHAITTNISIETGHKVLNDLFSTGGMAGMLDTIWLIVCAMVFGGAMEAIGALKKITEGLLSLFNTTFGLFASTFLGCITVNITASDQYLSIVLPGKMLKDAFESKGLAPENLSRTLEDTGTVTSALIPWNTCGAYQSSVLGVPTLSYLPFAFFNILSPFMTLIYAYFKIKINYKSNLKNEN